MMNFKTCWDHSAGGRAWMFLCLTGLGLLNGCAAFHPLDGISAQRLPAEYRTEPRSCQVPIDLSRLRQSPPAEYRVDRGDLLGIFVEGVLGEPDKIPPITIANNPDIQPSLGYPILVQDDGTISLPGLADLNVRGMTLREIRERLRYAYTVENPLLLKKNGNTEEAHILVNLQRKRTYRVMVIRQEPNTANNFSASQSQVDLSVIRQGSGQVVQLPAYENDVLHALTQTGGLPSSQAENAVYVIRRRPQYVESLPLPSAPPAPMPAGYPHQSSLPASGPVVAPVPAPISQTGYSTGARYGHQPSYQPAPPATLPAATLPGHSPQRGGNPYGSYRLRELQPAVKPGNQRASYTIRGQSPDMAHRATMPASGITSMPGAMFWDEASLEAPEIIRIPLRVYPGEQPAFTEADIILQEGDIVFVQSRETEFFFTGGLLGGGQYVLPQNYDLDLLEALSIVQSEVNTSFNSNTKAIGGVSALNHDVTVGASKVIILRKAPNGCEIKIKVDLYDAIRDPRERVLIQPGDYVLLQYTRMEAVAAFIERHILEGAVIGAASNVIFGN